MIKSFEVAPIDVQKDIDYIYDTVINKNGKRSFNYTKDRMLEPIVGVTIRYNEAGTVTGAPTIAVTNGNQGSGSGRGPHTLVYASGTGSNELIFNLAIAAANAATNAGDILTIGAQNILKPGGATIKDAAGTASDSAVAISGAQGTAAGTLTVTA